jgi:3-hydroxyacyl-[acyl-carrier-protein] dehydratase
MESGITQRDIEMDPFYDIISTKEEEKGILQFQIKIHANHPVFKGHFPDFPVVPGAMMIKIFKELINNFFGKYYMLSSSRDIKFLALIEPVEDKILDIEIKYQLVSELLSTSITVKENETISLKMSGNFLELPTL